MTANYTQRKSSESFAGLSVVRRIFPEPSGSERLSSLFVVFYSFHSNSVNTNTFRRHKHDDEYETKQAQRSLFALVDMIHEQM